MHNHGNNHSFTTRDVFHWNTNLASLWQFLLHEGAAPRSELKRAPRLINGVWLEHKPWIQTLSLEIKKWNLTKWSILTKHLNLLVLWIRWSSTWVTPNIDQLQRSGKVTRHYVFILHTFFVYEWQTRKLILRFVDSFTVPLRSPNGRHCLPLGLCKGAVTGIWKTVRIPTDPVSPQYNEVLGNTDHQARAVYQSTSVLTWHDIMTQATGLDAWASRVKCPARFVSHLHDICIYMSCL